MSEDITKDIIKQLNFNIWNGKIEEILLSDEKFVEDLDNFPGLLMAEKFKGKTVEEMKEFLDDCIIGNTCRTYILNLLAIKHIYRLLKTNSIFNLDDFWQSRLDNFLFLGGNNQNSTLFDQINIAEPINLVKTLLAKDDNFIKLFNEVFCQEQNVNKDNIVHVVTSFLTSSPTYELAVTFFIFKYITNALESGKAQFIEDAEFKNIIKKISDVLK